MTVQPLRRVAVVARKELKVLRRDRFYLFMALVLPVVTMVVMGYGLSYDVKGLPLGVADLDRTAESRAFVDAFTVSEYFRLVTTAESGEALEQALQGGRIRMAIVIPPGFARALHRGQSAQVQILIDASFATRAEIARGYTEALVAQFNVERLRRLTERLPAEAVKPIGLDVVGRVWFNPTLQTKYFMIPGLLVITLLFWAPILVSLSVTREKESGAILNVQTASLARWEYVIGKLAPYVAVSFISYILLLAAAVGLFRVPVKGSTALLTGAAVLYIVALMGLGLLVSVLVRTQVAALLVTATIVMSIGIFYSGWLAPLSTLDAQGQLMSRLLPTADFMTLTRGVFLKGLSFATYRGTMMALGLYALVFTVLPILGFRKRRR